MISTKNFVFAAGAVALAAYTFLGGGLGLGSAQEKAVKPPRHARLLYLQVAASGAFRAFSSTPTAC
jgi:hypothetical protein